MSDDEDDFADAARRLRQAIWDSRWSLGVSLGLVWLACVALLAWSTWMSA